jgi:tryptophan halogenase
MINKSIIIVGGGSAGWMAAAYLSTKGCSVTLVESADIPIVGVGESTLPAMNNFCQQLGLNESQWMQSCSAVYKLGINHTGWSTKRDHWWHWFIYDRQNQNSQHNYLQNNTLPDQDKLEYGYHVDATAFGQSLQPLALSNGCKHLVDKVSKVALTDSGSIASLHTESGITLIADYYIDCTGWTKMLTTAVGSQYQPYTYLVNDRAIACPQILSGTPDRYTKTFAKSAGWIWDIALTNRRGTGYVYSSKYISDQQAIDEYCEHFPHTDRTKIRQLRFTPEKCIDPFNKNVCAVGLSSGFIEPLEATSLFLTQYNIMNFYKVISTDRSPAVFNRAQAKLVDEIYLYILAHYTLSDRQDNEYWQHYQAVEKIINTRQLAADNAKKPDINVWQSTGLFFPYNWWAMLEGYGLND